MRGKGTSPRRHCPVVETRPGVVLIALVVGAVGLLSLVTLGSSLVDGVPGNLSGFVVRLVLAALLIVAAVGLLRVEKWGLVLALLLLLLEIATGLLNFSTALVDLAILGLEVVALVYLVTIRDEFL